MNINTLRNRFRAREITPVHQEMCTALLVASCGKHVVFIVPNGTEPRRVQENFILAAQTAGLEYSVSPINFSMTFPKTEGKITIRKRRQIDHLLGLSFDHVFAPTP